jgi:hypothetical protein
LEQAPARGGDVFSGDGGEELLEEDVALVRCLSGQLGAQLPRGEARGGTEEVRRIGLEVPGAGERLHPIADHLGLAWSERDTGGLAAGVEPPAPEGHGTARWTGEHGEGGNALLAPALMPFQLWEDRGVTPGVESGGGHGHERP